MGFKPTRIVMLLVLGLLALFHAPVLLADTVVTTYVTKVQEERETTRWTLTEWLRIKERTKMMDVWLAMFSDPKKATFTPELNLTYGMMRGAVALKDGAGTESSSSVTGVQGRAQLWLTNLVSSTVGVRTLNIDLGGEVYQRSRGGFVAQAATAATSTDPSASTDTESNVMKQSYYTGNLRLFGKNVQDSSLVFKYGEYQSTNTIPDATDEDARIKGKVAGAELQVYLMKWLGAEGNYLAYGDSKRAQGSDDLKGSYYDYSGFVEVSLLRLMVGHYQEDWQFAGLGEVQNVSESGMTFGAKLSF